MKMILEIENEEERAFVEEMARSIQIPLTVTVSRKKQNVEALIAYADRHPLKSESVVIPSREERNER